MTLQNSKCVVYDTNLAFKKFYVAFDEIPKKNELI